MKAKGKIEVYHGVLIFVILMYILNGLLYSEERIVKGELCVQGLTLQIDPSEQTVPINTPTSIKTIFYSGNQEIPSGIVVKGELRGPSISGSITLTTLPNQLFSIPPFPVKGVYTLEDIRLEKDGVVLSKANPDKAVISVIDLVVTRVETRPLTLEEIREKGIMINEQNFTVYNFSVGFLIESKEVKIEFPVIFTPEKTIVIDGGGGGLGIGGGFGGLSRSDFVPFSLEIPELPKPSGDEGEKIEKKFAGVLVFNNSIAFLNQFFSAMFIITNNAPEGSPLFLKDVKAKITYPDGLREAQTNPPHIVGTPIPVKCPGPDGKIGTSDDIDIILATFSGMAEFLAEGLKEGTHIVKVDFEGTLSGLPSGDVPVKGTASGAVIVRYPEFSVSFAHPSVVRAGEEYDIFVTLTNTSNTTANLVSLTMPKTRLIGTKLLSDERIEWETIPAGESRTAKFHLLSLETGKVRATAFSAEGNVKGAFILTAGVGEKGIPLSPDTLTLPSYTYSLPGNILETAMLLLGEAYSISTIPPSALPKGLPYVNRETVKIRAIELAEAGQRFEYGDELISSLEVLFLDWLGNRTSNISFDQLRRLTTKGKRFAQEIANEFNEVLKTTYIKDFQKSFAENCSYKNPFLSVSLSSGSKKVCSLKITDKYSNRLAIQGSELIRETPYGEIISLQEMGINPVDFALIGALDPDGYNIEVIGNDSGRFDLSIIVPDGSGSFRQVIFSNIECRKGSVSKISIKQETQSFILSTDLDGDGVNDFDSQGFVSNIYEPPLRLISAIQDCVAEPAGNAVALFFNKEVDEASSKIKENYFSQEKEILCSFLQPSRRVVIIGLSKPVSPFVESKIRVSNLKDRKGNSMEPVSVEVPIKATIKTPGGIVFGKVLKPDGTPIPNAIIKLLEIEKGLIFDTQVVRFYTSTDENGNYQFDFVRILDDPFEILAIDPSTGKSERVTARLREHGQRFNIDIIFRGRGNLNGKVKMEDGSLVPDAHVSATVLSHYETETFYTKTNPQGEFLLSDTPVGRIDLFAMKGNACGYAVSSISYPGEVSNAEIIIVPVKTGKILGRVLKADGVTPVEKAVVRVIKNGQAIFGQYADTNGNFSFENVPVGSFTISVLNPLTGKEGGRIDGNLSEGQIYTANIILRGNGSISGKVLSYNGTPLEEIIVYLQGTGHHTKTDSNGDFILSEIPVGKYIVTAVDSKNNAQASTNADIYTEGQEVKVTLVFPDTTKGGITGKVLKADGVTPVPYINVIVCDGNYIIHGVTKTKNDGSFSFGNLSPGSYTLVAYGNGIDAGVANAVIQFPGHFVTKDVKLRGLGKIKVNVFSSDGQTRVMADIILYHPVLKLKQGDFIGFDMEETRVTTDANGYAEFDNIFVGDFTIEAFNAFYPYPVRKFGKISSEGEIVPIDIILKPSGKIEGRVLLFDKTTPVQNAKVTLKTSTLPPQTLFSDDNGEFLFTLVPSGHFEVQAEDQINGYKGNVYGYISPEGGTVKLEIILKGKGFVYGYVKNLQENPIPNASVTLKSVGFPNEEFRTVSDSNGRFLFSNVSEGKIVLEAKDPISLLGGRATGELIGNGSEVRIDIYLEKSGKIEGKILSPDWKNTVSNAQLVLYHQRFDFPFGFYVSDSNGNYKFEHVPEGNFRIEVFDPVSGRKGKATGQIKTEGETVNLDIRLEGRGNVEGTFFDSTGMTPISGAEIKIRGKGTFPFETLTMTDSSGRFSFSQVGEGDFELEGFDTSTGLKGKASGKIEYDGQTVLINIYAQGSGTVKGKVLRADGVTPVSNAFVNLYSSGNRYTTVAGSNGEFIFRYIPVASFTIIAEEQAGRDKGKISGSITFNNQELELNVILKGLGIVKGIVYDGSGNPVSDVNVKLTSQNEFGTEYFNTSTNSNGEFVFSSIRVGSFSLEAKHPITGLGASFSGEIKNDGEIVTANLILESAGSVIGRVLNSDGVTPADKATIKLQGTNFTLWTSSNSSGDFRFNSVRLGTFTLSIEGLGNTGKARLKGELKTNNEELNLGEIILDNQPPTIVSIFPAHGSTNLPLNTAPVITFSEEIELSTVSNNISLNNPQGRVQASVVLSSDKKTVVITPGTSLQSLTLHTVLIKENLEDLAGNKLGTTISSYFTTLDNIPPSVVEVYPPNNSIQIPLDSSITVKFSEPIDPSKFGHQNITVLRNGNPITGSISFEDNNIKVRFIPQSLEANSDYSISVRDAVDFSGNIQTSVFTSSFKTIDTIPPTLNLIPPASGTTVKEGTQVSVSADVGGAKDIAKVYFYINGELKFTDAYSPYVFTFNAPYISEIGSNTFIVEALAQDFAGNLSERKFIQFTLLQDIPPTITLEGPSNTTVYPRQVITCKVSASDDIALRKIVFFARGGNLNYQDTKNINQTNYVSNYSFNIPYDIAPGTLITVSADATDSRGNTVSATSIILNVPEDSSPPQIQITSPANGAQFRYKDLINISASVQDDVGIKEVKFYIDDTLLETDTTPPYSTQYTAPPFQQDTQMRIKAEAIDVSGKISAHEITITILKLIDPTAPTVKILCPSDGAYVYPGENLIISAEAKDDQGVAKVEFYVNNELLTEISNPPYQTTYQVPGNLEDGTEISIRAVVYDFSDKTGTDEVKISVIRGEVIPAGTLIDENNTQYDGKTIIIKSGTVTINGTHSFKNVLVVENGIITHSSATTSKTYSMNLNVEGKLIVSCSAKISADGRGYLGGRSGGNNSDYGRTLGNAQGSGYDSGGSYGGYGGKYSNNPVNEIYGSIYEPSELGSGGGGVVGDPGGNGGGLIRIKAKEIVLDGVISANGESKGYWSEGGSGGSVKVETSILRGSGKIEANGGSPGGGAAGGGGRIAVYYEDATGFDLGKVTAYGGISGNGSDAKKNGGAGTVYLKPSSQPYGNLIIDNRNTSTSGYSTTFLSVGQGFSTSLEPNRLTNSSANWIPNSLIGIKLNPYPNETNVFTIISNNTTTIDTDLADGDMTQISQPGYPYIGEHHLFDLTVKGKARVLTLDRIKVFGTLTVESGSTLKAENLER